MKVNENLKDKKCDICWGSLDGKVVFIIKNEKGNELPPICEKCYKKILTK